METYCASVAPDGFDQWQVQPYAMRAPEVWLDLGCSHRSDVWSLATTVLVWMKPGILGTAGIKDDFWPSIWCPTKLMGVFPGWTGLLTPTTPMRRNIGIAKLLLVEPDPDRPEEPYFEVSPLDDELRALHISNEVSNLIRRLMVPDLHNRPEAAEALTSPEFHALLQKVAVPGVEYAMGDSLHIGSAFD